MIKIRYNTERKLSSYNKVLKIIRKHGYKPIAVAQLMFEDTFVFETDEEATKAHGELENIPRSKVVGWWYGREEFIKVISDYETKEQKYKDPDDEFKVKIYWL